jgi:hypothetical protein
MLIPSPSYSLCHTIHLVQPVRKLTLSDHIIPFIFIVFEWIFIGTKLLSSASIWSSHKTVLSISQYFCNMSNEAFDLLCLLLTHTCYNFQQFLFLIFESTRLTMCTVKIGVIGLFSVHVGTNSCPLQVKKFFPLFVFQPLYWFLFVQSECSTHVYFVLVKFYLNVHRCKNCLEKDGTLLQVWNHTWDES